MPAACVWQHQVQQSVREELGLLKLNGLQPGLRLCHLPAVTLSPDPGASSLLVQPRGGEEQMYVDCLAWLPAHSICAVKVSHLLND